MEKERRENEMGNWRSSAKKKRKIWTMQREGRTNEKKKNVGLERAEREKREERREKVTGHVEIGVFQQGTTGVLFFWIAPVAFTTKGRGLTFTFARVLVRAQIDGPGLQPTDKKWTTRSV